MAVAPSRFVLPYQTVIDATGVPIPGAQLFFYESGTNTPLNTYSNAGLTVPNANPVVADAGGQFPNIFMLPQAYKVVLEDALGDQIWTADPLEGTGGSGNARNIRVVTGNTTVLATDELLEVDATLGPVTITYPLDFGSANSGVPVEVIKIDASINLVNIIDDSGPTLRYALAIPANGVAMQGVEIYSNGTSLRVLI